MSAKDVDQECWDDEDTEDPVTREDDRGNPFVPDLCEAAFAVDLMAGRFTTSVTGLTVRERPEYLDALSAATEDEVRQAIREALEPPTQ